MCLLRISTMTHPGLWCWVAGVDSLGSEVNGRLPKHPAVQAKEPGVIRSPPLPSRSSPSAGAAAPRISVTAAGVTD